MLEGRPHIVDAITNGEVDIVFNTTEGAKALANSFSIRRSALLYHIPYYTTLAGALAVTQAIRALRAGGLTSPPAKLCRRGAWQARLRRLSKSVQNQQILDLDRAIPGH